MSDTTGDANLLVRENERLRRRVEELEAEATRFTAEEEETRLSRQRLDLHVKHTPLAVIEFTRDGRIARWNPAAADIFGFSEEEAVGQHWTLVVPKEVWSQLDGVWEGLISQRGRGRSTNLNRHKSGRILHCEWFNTPLVTADGTAIGVASLVMDVTERNLAQEELARHRDQLRELVQARTAELELSEARLIEAQKVAHLGSWEWDVALDAITASQEFYRLFDVEPEQIARYQQFVECLHPGDRERVGTEVSEALRQNRVYDTDYRVRLRDGGWRDIHARGKLHTDADGKPVRLAGTCMDVTERKRAEAMVRQIEERNRATLYSIGDAVIATDAQSRINRMNPVAESLTGWTEAEAEGKPLDEVFRIVNEETRAVVESPVTRVLREGQVVGLANHTLLVAKDGTERPIADSGAPIRDEKGETTGVVLVFRDQTEERAAQRSLQESERRYRTLAESLPHLVWTCRADGSCDYLSPRWVDFTGIPEADQLGYRWIEQLHPDDRERVIAEWSEVAPRGGVFDIEFRIRRADGAYRWFTTRAIPFLDEGGRVVKWFGSNTDIDDHKRVHEALRESEALYRSLFDNMMNGFAHCQMLFDRGRPVDFIYLNVNQAFEAKTGLKNVVGRKVSEVIPGIREGNPELLETYGRVAVTGKPEVFEIHVEALDMWFAISVYSPKREHFVAVFDVITERKRAQQEIESLARFPAENPNPILRVRHGGKIIYANASSEDLLVGWGCAVGDFLPSNLRDLIATSVAQNASATVDATFNNRVFSLLFAPIPGTDYVNLYCRDITDRVRAEEAVRESEERNRTTLQSLGDAVIATDGSGRIAQMNPVAEALTGWLEAEARGQTLASVFRIVNEETRAVVESPVALVLRKGQVVGLANHTVLIAKDGKERPIADSGAPIRNAKGETTGVVLVFRDQTEERRAGDALRRSEALLRAVIEGTTNLVCVKDQDGKIVIANSAMTRFIGKPESEIIGKCDLELVAEAKQAAEIMANDRRIMATGCSETVEETGEGPAGRWDYLFTKSPYHDLDGQVIGVIGIGTDITERKRAEKLVLEQYAILRAILQSTDASVFSLDREYRYTTFNGAHAAMMKALYGVDIQIGASLADYQSVLEDWQAARKNFDRALRGEAFVESSLSGEEDRSRRYLEIFHSPIRTGANEIIGVAVYSRDVTECKRAENEIRLLNVNLEQRVRDRTTELEASNNELEAFSYSVSHDLRAPLRAIDGFTRILADEYASQMDTEGKRLCSVVRENAKSMAQLIDDLLAFSRLGRAEMNLSRIDMGAMANAVFHELTTPESRGRIDFQIGNLPPAVADPTLMRQVWMNLLSNAIKFSSQRDRAIIRVSARQSQGETVYAVQDDGAGFEMQYVGKLFGVFQRLHSAREFEGTGVGLALVQRVIRRHGGRVWAEGEPDKGATFYFALQERGA
jgi:PAS domain S-box-containing protein